MHGLPPVASAISCETIPGIPGALFATLLLLAGQQEIAVDPRPGPLAWLAFRLALGIALGHHAAPAF